MKRPNVPEIGLEDDINTATTRISISWGRFYGFRVCRFGDIGAIEANINSLLEELGQAIMKAHETR